MTTTRFEHDRIVKYYEKSWYDYRGVWMDKRNRAMHYGFWDARTRDHSDSLLRMNQELAAHAQITEGARILDAGCGVGGSSIWLAETFGAQVVGITLCSFQVDKARRYAAERGLSDLLTFEVSDFCDTGFAPDSFDFVWAQESVCYARNKADFLRESHRLLRPGGRIAVEDGFRTSRDLPEDAEGLIMEWADAWAFPDLDTFDEFDTAAESVGFQNISIRDIREHALRSARRLHRAARIFRGPSRFITAAGWRAPEAHRNLVGASLQWPILRQGFGTIALVSASKV
ncbi:methyltransferase domain-containing protein [Nocardia sp. NPDC057227]|uniref:methyltransferase domain-containing protein n=1 Tax=Nocardia sp. NPDC057227 TaxID=3346056 RepID=UPI003626C98D